MQALLHLRLAANVGDEQESANRFKDNNALVKFHAKLVETQLLLSERLGASIKLAR